MKVFTNMWLIHKETGERVKVLCNCPRASPRHHTKRVIEQNIDQYRYLTEEEKSIHV